MFLILSFLFSFSVFSQELHFPKHNFDHHHKSFGIEHSFVHEDLGKAKFILTILKVEKLLSEDVQGELKKIILNKTKSSKSPWKQVKIQKIDQLNWNPKKEGYLGEVHFMQNNLPQAALVGVIPTEKNYYFIYSTSELLEFKKLNQIFRKFIQDTKIGL